MNIKEVLAAAIQAAAEKAQANGKLPQGAFATVALEVPPKKEFGDFSSNFAMQCARSLRCNPRMIAQAVIDNMDCPFVDRMEIAGAGFLNFYLKPDWLSVMLGKSSRQEKIMATCLNAMMVKFRWSLSVLIPPVPCM